MKNKKVTLKTKPGAVRFGVSMHQDLLTEFDNLIRRLGWPNRSEAIRHLVRERLAEHEWELPEAEVVGTVTMVYHHGRHELDEKLTEIQHHFFRQVISTMHIHLDEHNCLEILAIRGRGREIKNIADRLLHVKGIKVGKLTMTTTGKRLP